MVGGGSQKHVGHCMCVRFFGSKPVSESPETDSRGNVQATWDQRWDHPRDACSGRHRANERLFLPGSFVCVTNNATRAFTTNMRWDVFQAGQRLRIPIVVSIVSGGSADICLHNFLANGVSSTFVDCRSTFEMFGSTCTCRNMNGRPTKNVHGGCRKHRSGTRIYGK